jgi:hypothetical protein
VALQAEVLAEHEALVRAVRRAQQVRRAFRQLERLAMPLVDLKGVGERPDPAACDVARHDLDRHPADLGHGIAAHLGAERLGHELSTETVPEHRHVRVDGAPDQRDLALDPGERVVHAHRSAHEDDAARALEVVGHRVARLEAHDLEMNALAVEEVS